MPENKPMPVRLVITACNSVYTGTNAKGEYTIYEVEAIRENGSPVERKLRSFEELPVGAEPVDCTVTKFDSEKHGESWTVARKGGKVSSSKRIEELQGQVTDLVARVQRLEAASRTEPAGDATPVTASAPTGELVGAAADIDDRFGSEAPF